MSEDWLTSTQAAEAVGLSMSAFYCYVRRGEIKPVAVIGQTNMFDPADLEDVKRRTRGRKPSVPPAHTRTDHEHGQTDHQ